MWRPLIPLFAVMVSSLGFSIPNAGPHCPPPEELNPCTCSDTGEVATVCKNIKDGNDLTSAFSKNSNWNIQRLYFDHCIVDYIPSSILGYESLRQLNISSSTLNSVFDEAPLKTSEFNIYMYDTKILRGIEWELFRNSSISGFGTFQVEIRHFGKEFKEFMPEGVKNLWFENSKTARITDQAFQRMVNLELFTLTGGWLKKITRDMFPRPWNVKFLNLSQQKITVLPKDMFDDFPQLIIFSLMKNNLKAIDMDVFKKGATTYYLNDNPIYCDCSVKWITTSGKQSYKRFIGKCEDPDSFKGKELKTLKEEDFSFCG